MLPAWRDGFLLPDLHIQRHQVATLTNSWSLNRWALNRSITQNNRCQTYSENTFQSHAIAFERGDNVRQRWRSTGHQFTRDQNPVLFLRIEFLSNLASNSSNSIGAPTALKTARTQSISSGPTPSPGTTVTWYLWDSTIFSWAVCRKKSLARRSVQTRSTYCHGRKLS